MIYNKKHEKGEVVAIKLVTGDEVIAKLVEADMDDIRLSKPMMLVQVVILSEIVMQYLS